MTDPVGDQGARWLRLARQARWPVLTLLAGAIGSSLAALSGIPAAWLAGAMIIVAALALAGLPMTVPAPLRNAAFVMLGISMGSGVTPETVNQLRALPLSFLLLAGSVAATLFGGSFYLRRVHGWDRATARFAAVPGALTAVLILAVSSEANLPRVAVAQSIRLFTLVAAMPWLIGLWNAGREAAHLPAAIVSGPFDILVTIGASAAMAALLARLRMPGGVLLGAMLASALLHGAGLVTGRLPEPLLTAGFIATGCLIGARFSGTSLALLRGTLPGAAGSVLVALLLSASFAAAGAYLLGLPFGQLWLAYAPGGVEAMAIMALALGLDPAFVGGHHVVRLIGLNLSSPFWGRDGSRSSQRRNESGQG